MSAAAYLRYAHHVLLATRHLGKVFLLWLGSPKNEWARWHQPHDLSQNFLPPIAWFRLFFPTWEYYKKNPLSAPNGQSLTVSAASGAGQPHTIVNQEEEVNGHHHPLARCFSVHISHTDLLVVKVKSEEEEERGKKKKRRRHLQARKWTRSGVGIFRNLYLSYVEILSLFSPSPVRRLFIWGTPDGAHLAR